MAVGAKLSTAHGWPKNRLGALLLRMLLSVAVLGLGSMPGNAQAATSTGKSSVANHLCTNGGLRAAAATLARNPDLAQARHGDVAKWDTSNVTSMAEVFHHAKTFNADLNGWCVSRATDLSRMFHHAEVFNSDLSSWNVSQAKNMEYLFYHAYHFNSDLSSWDVSRATYLAYMFGGARAFKSDLSSWDVSRATIMCYMFYSTDDKFNSDLSSWDVSQATSLSSVFYHAHRFNSNLSTWDVSQATRFEKMFDNAKAFTSDLSSWDLSQGTTMHGMFSNAIKFNSDLSSWDVSRATCLSSMFSNAFKFNSDLSSWDISQATSLSYMFQHAYKFNSDLSGWDVSRTTSLYYTFSGAYRVNADLNNWDVSQATDLRGVFHYAKAFNSDLNSWDVSRATNMQGMFYNAGNFKSDLSSWDVGRVKPGAMDSMFSASPMAKAWCHKAKIARSPAWAASLAFRQYSHGSWAALLNTSITDAGFADSVTRWVDGAHHVACKLPDGSPLPMLQLPRQIAGWDVSRVKTLQRAFQHSYDYSKRLATFQQKPALRDLDLSRWDVSQVTNMQHTFSKARQFNADLDAWDVSKVTDMQQMFFMAQAFNATLAAWDVSRVTSTESMFAGCIRSSPGGYSSSQCGATMTFNTDVSTWNVGNVASMKGMFTDAKHFNADISKWNVSSVTSARATFARAEVFNADISKWTLPRLADMYMTFQGALAFNVPIHTWVTSKVTRMTYAFQGAKVFDQPIDSWNTASVTSMYGMFQQAKAFNAPIDSWDTSNVKSMADMFRSDEAFNQPIDSWGTSSVTSMHEMFKSAKAFNQNINSWQTSSVTHMDGIFSYTAAFNQPLDSWNTSSVANTRSMFSQTSAFNQPLDSWNTSSAKWMVYMFNSAKAFNQPIASWDTSSVTSMEAMFNHATAFDQPLDAWETSSVGNMGHMFNYATAFNSPLDSWGMSSATRMNSMFSFAGAFNQALGSWGTSSATRINSMFEQATVFNQDIDSWQTSSVAIMYGTFSNAKSFNQPLASWDVSSTTNMACMFCNAESFDQLIIQWNVANVHQSASAVFQGTALAKRRPCSEFATVRIWSKQGGRGFRSVAAADDQPCSAATGFGNTLGTGLVDSTLQGVVDVWLQDQRWFNSSAHISKWNTSAIKDMSGLFDCTRKHQQHTPEQQSSCSTFNGNISRWYISGVTDVSAMFRGAAAFNADLSRWDTSRVVHFAHMLEGAMSFTGSIEVVRLTDQNAHEAAREWFRNRTETATVVGDIIGWNMASVTNMSRLFAGRARFNAGIGGWNTSSATSMASMFHQAEEFNADISRWDVSRVHDLRSAFEGAKKFNQSLAPWNVSQVAQHGFGHVFELNDLHRCHRKAVAMAWARANTFFKAAKDWTSKGYYAEWSSLATCVEFKFEAYPDRQRGGRYHDYDTDTEYTNGTHYVIAPLRMDKGRTKVTAGTVDDIVYKLDQTETNFCVEQNTGVISGYFEKPGSFTMSLEAMDAGLQKDTVEVYTFNVAPAVEFRVFPREHHDGRPMRVPASKLKVAASELADYDNLKEFVTGKAYKIAPPMIDETKTRAYLSKGTVDNITYRLEQPSSTDFYVNSGSGVIYGSFTHASPPQQPYNMTLVAVDASRQEAVLGKFAFAVRKAEFKVVADKDRARDVCSQCTDYDARVAKEEPFYPGQSYRIEPKHVDRDQSMFSDGDESHLTYKLKQPEGVEFFVNSETGVIFGEFEDTHVDISPIDIRLIAVDKAALESELETYTFNVEKAPTFQVEDGWVFDTSYQDRDYSDTARCRSDATNAPIHTNSTSQCNLRFGVGDNDVHIFPPINLTTFKVLPNAEAAITFTLEDPPPGFLVDPSTGFVHGSANQKGERPYSTKLIAIDGTTAQRQELVHYEITLLEKDTVDPANGPGGKDCRGGKGERIDPDSFDGKFSCRCKSPDGDVGFSGANCGTIVCRDGTRLARETHSSADCPAFASSGGDSGAAVGGTLGVVLLLIVAAAAVLQYRAYQNKYRAEDFALKLADMLESGDILPDQASESNVPREIRRASLKMIDKLGKGAFGEVWKALLDESAQHGGRPEYLVAAKTVLGGANNVAGRDDLLHEAVVMAQVKAHPHLVAIVGVITRGDPLVLVVSFCEHGSLLAMLKKRAAAGQTFSTPEKLRFCGEIADGTGSLTRQHFVHRDLAARNVLLGTGMVCKVADFGLSRGVHTDDNDTDYYRSERGMFPVKWTAPEGMSQGKFSAASDVWSFGITCVEIFQDGLMPYVGMSNPAVMQLVGSGGIHPLPSNCSADAYAILVRCWAMEPADRPMFAELTQLFGVLRAGHESHGTRGALPGGQSSGDAAGAFVGGLLGAAAPAKRTSYEYDDGLATACFPGAGGGEAYFDLGDGGAVDEAAMSIARQASDVKRDSLRRPSVASTGSGSGNGRDAHADGAASLASPADDTDAHEHGTAEDAGHVVPTTFGGGTGSGTGTDAHATTTFAVNEAGYLIPLPATSSGSGGAAKQHHPARSTAAGGAPGMGNAAVAETCFGEEQFDGFGGGGANTGDGGARATAANEYVEFGSSGAGLEI